MSEKDRLDARAADLKAAAERIPGRNLAKEFKDFILRGNVVDLAIGVAIGAAFSDVVKSVTSSFITPLIGVFVPGNADFAQKSFSIPQIFSNEKSTFVYGTFVNAVIAFLAIAAVLFFLVVKPVNHLLNARKTEEPVAATTRDCPFCFSSVPLKATKCAFCTADLEAKIA